MEAHRTDNTNNHMVTVYLGTAVMYITVKVKPTTTEAPQPHSAVTNKGWKNTRKRSLVGLREPPSQVCPRKQALTGKRGTLPMRKRRLLRRESVPRYVCSPHKSLRTVETT